MWTSFSAFSWERVCRIPAMLRGLWNWSPYTPLNHNTNMLGEIISNRITTVFQAIIFLLWMEGAIPNCKIAPRILLTIQFWMSKLFKDATYYRPPKMKIMILTLLMSIGCFFVFCFYLLWHTSWPKKKQQQQHHHWGFLPEV